MKRLAILLVALSLGGCATGPSIFAGGSSLTATINNPVGPVDIYRVKAVYASLLDAVAGYRAYCWSKPYAALMADPIAKPICQNRRSIIRAADKADDHAFDAISKADTFIRNNPTISAVSVISEAWAAVTDFQNQASATAASITTK